METKRSWEQFKGQTRLPKFAIPKRYDLFLKPDLSACTFSGTVQVSLNIIEDTKFLVLNALEIVIQEVRFTDSNNQVTTNLTLALYDDGPMDFFWVFNRCLFLNFCRHIGRVMLFWRVMMRYWCWFLMSCLILVKEFCGLSFLRPLTST